MKLKVLVVALALFAGTAVASAADSAWFSLISGGTLVSEGPGQTLVIDKPLGAGTTVLTIGYNFTAAEQFGTATLAGYGFGLTSVNLNGGTQNAGFGGSNFAPGNALNFNIDLPGIAGGNAIFSAGGGAINNDGSPGLVFTFDITITKADPSLTTTDIFGQLDDQANSTGYAWFGNFGPNANQYGKPISYADGPFGGNNANLPVISITNIPEPATIALLGMGVVALIRRRR